MSESPAAPPTPADVPAEDSRIRVLVAEDNADLRTVLRAVLDGEPDLRCVGAIGTPDEVLPLARSTQPHVVVLDLLLEGGSSLHLIRMLQTALPGVRIVMYSGYGSDVTAREALRRGAAEFVVKSADVEPLLAAVRRIGRR